MRNSLGLMPTSLVHASGVVSDDDLVLRAKRGDTAALNELIERHNDLLQRKAGVFARAPIPNSVVHAQAIKLMRIAVDRYQPGQVRFRTFLESTVRLNRFVTSNKGAARIPEHRALLIRRYLATKEVLRSEKDREPSNTEVAEALRWSVTDVDRLERAVNRRELAASSMQFDQISSQTDRFKETAEFLYFGLSAEEQLVFDYSLGAHGKPRIRSVKEMSAKTGISTDKIYEIKRRIARKLAQSR